ncbi:MAG: hypothetical protein JXA67_21740 [Micromonosporaceae bacterium]|nr:hypothetical protein [Micromonosporaceae bacterium]
MSGPPMSGPPSSDLVAVSVDPLSASNYPRRIIPSPKPQRGRVVLGIMIGLLLGFVLFGSGGFVVARVTAEPAKKQPPQPAPSASAQLSVYQQSQLTRNRTKVTGNLVAFAEPRLPYVAGCVNNNDRYGPKTLEGEATRVSCEQGAATMLFIEYRTIADRDKARTRRLGQNVDARTLTPGVAEPTQNREAADGYYIEYAYEVVTDDGNRVYAGIWWDNAAEPVAGYLFTPWIEGIDSKWDPLRDLWHHS